MGGRGESSGRVDCARAGGGTGVGSEFMHHPRA